MTFIMVLSLLAFLDFLVFNSQLKSIIQQYKQTKVFCSLLIQNIELTADDEENIRMISFGQIKNMLLGRMKSLDGMQFFRVRFKGSHSDIYFTTEDNTKETFDHFTSQFVKQVDEFNNQLLPSQKRIVKKLVNMKPENILQS